MTILDSLFATTDDGTYADFNLDKLADFAGVTVDEADQFIESLYSLGLVGVTHNGDVYNMAEREEWEEAEEEADADDIQAVLDARMGYAFACC